MGLDMAGAREAAEAAAEGGGVNSKVGEVK